MIEISQARTEDLIPYAKNARTHTAKQVAQIAASIREFGFVNPVLLKDDSTIIAGHGRVLAARKLGLDTVPVVYLSHLSDTQARAYVIADNKLALNAGWDEELLNLELADLVDEGFDLELLGFDQIAEEVIKEPAEETISRPFKKIHILISVATDNYDKVKEHIDKIESMNECEVVYGAN